METNGYRLLLPEGTLDYFNISDVKESRIEITIYLEEKNKVPNEYSESKVESKGFYYPDDRTRLSNPRQEGISKHPSPPMGFKG